MRWARCAARSIGLKGLSAEAKACGAAMETRWVSRGKRRENLEKMEKIRGNMEEHLGKIWRKLKETGNICVYDGEMPV